MSIKDRVFRLWENSVLAFQALRDRTFRSILTVMGVFIGVVIIIGVASVLNGFRQRVVDGIEQFGTSNIYITRFPLFGVGGGRHNSELRKRKVLKLDDAWAIRDECPAVQAASPVLTAWTDWMVVKYGGEEMVGPQLRGAFPVHRDVMGVGLADGRFYTEEENRRSDPVCIIGYNVVQAFFPRRSPIGKELSLSGRKFRIIGVMEKFKDDPFGQENPQDSLIMLPYYSFKALFPTSRPRDHFIVVRARTGQVQKAVEQIEDVLRRRRHVAWKDENDFEVGTSQSIIQAFDKIVFATVAVMFALSAVAFLVGGVGVMNVMLASVRERTREIGVRRAIGARRRDIIWQFLTEAMAMTGTGGLLGIIAGELIARSLSSLLPSLPCATPMWARAFGFLGSVCVGLIFGLWPAIAAARLDPIKALRYE